MGDAVEAVSGVLQVLMIVLGIAVSMLPLILAIWLVVQVGKLTRDVAQIRRDVDWLAAHAPEGPPPPAPPPATRRSGRGWLWAALGLLVAFVGLVVLTAFPLTSSTGSSEGSSEPVPPAPFLEPPAELVPSEPPA